MADSSKTVEILLKGKDLASDVIGGVGKSLSGINDSAEKLADIGNTVVGLEAALLGIGAAAANMANEVNQSTAKIFSSLQVSGEEAENFGIIAQRIFASGVPESLEEATNSVILAQQALQSLNLSDIDFESLVQSATQISKAFDADFNKTISASKVLMRDFGLTSEQSLDFIASGYQKGLNISNDFLDSINEYAPVLVDAGVNAGQLFSIMETGLSEGVLGTDKAVDAIAEFKKRLGETADPASQVSESYKKIGISLNEISVAKPIELFQKVIDKLNLVENENERVALGAVLIGTQYEDLGARAKGLDIAKTKIEDLAGANGRVSASFGDVSTNITSLFRTISLEVANLDMWDDFFASANRQIEKIKDILPEALGSVDTSQLQKAFEDLFNIFGDFFGELNLDTAEGLTDALQTMIDAVTGFQQVANGLIESWKPAISFVGEIIQAFNNLDAETKDTIGTILGFAQQIVLVGGVLGGAVAAVSGLSGIFTGLAAAAAPLGTALAAAFAPLTALAGGLIIGDTIRELIPGVDDAAQSFFGWADSILNFSGTMGEAGKEVEKTTKTVQDLNKEKVDLNKNITFTAEEIQGAIDNIDADIKSLIGTKNNLQIDLITATGEDKESILKNIAIIDSNIKELGKIKANAEIGIIDKAFLPIEEIKENLLTLDTEKTDIPVGMSLADFKAGVNEIVSFTSNPGKANVNVGAETQDAKKNVEQLIVEVNGKTMVLEVSADKPSIEKTKKDLEKDLPADKVLELRVELEKANIEAATAQFEAIQETTQTAIEWKAKLNIAEVEANVEIVTSQIDALASGFASSSSIISDSLGVLGGLDFGSAGALDVFKAITNQMNVQNDLQRETLDIQREIAEAQIKLNEAKAKQIASGQGIQLTVNAEGLQPQLEIIWFDIIAALQARINEEGGDMLLGL